MSEIKDWLRKYGQFFQSLDRDQLQHCNKIFDSQVRFKDPFNDVTGVEEVKRIFNHMFDVCDYCQFEICDSCGSEYQGYIHWKFHHQMKASTTRRTIIGLSLIRFNPQGEVVEHIDFWDSAEFVYEKLPVIGRIVTWIRKRYLQAV